MSFATVADYLRQDALNRLPNNFRDEFARSAFNRYYYSSYLLAREMLGEFKSDWKSFKHGEIPNFLRTTICKELRKYLITAKRNEDKPLIKKCSLAIESAKNLSKLLEEAYGVRVVADYYPECQVQFFGSEFLLNSVTDSKAKTWPSRAPMYLQSIRQVWAQFND